MVKPLKEWTLKEKEHVKNLYLKEGLSKLSIANKMSCAHSFIIKLLRQEGVQNRKEKFSKKGLESLRKTRVNVDKNLIISMYVKGNLSMHEISKRIGHSISVVSRILKNNNILKREKRLTEHGKNVLKNLYLGKTYEELYGEEKAKEMKEKLSKTHKGRIQSEEHRKRNSISQLKKIMPQDWKEHCRLGQLKRRERDGTTLLPEARNKIINYYKNNPGSLRGITGENHPGWKGGKSFEPYTKEFNKLFKEAVKERDKYTCLKCGLFEEDAKQLFNHPLSIHHIDYIKKNTFKENCCALCNRCNTEVNSNRSSWTKFFQSLLSETYGYKYDGNKNIIINLEEQRSRK